MEDYFAELFRSNYLEYYIVHKDYEFVQYILSKCKNNRSYKLYNYAICNYDNKMIKLLLQNNVEMSQDNAVIACEIGNYTALQCMIENNLQLNEYIFKVAIDSENIDIMKLLLDYKCPMYNYDNYLIDWIIEEYTNKVRKELEFSFCLIDK